MIKNNTELLEAILKNSASRISDKDIANFPIPTLLKWSTDQENQRLAFRAAWYIEHIFLRKTTLFEDYCQELIENYNQVTNWGALRSYSNLILWLFSERNNKIPISLQNQELIIEKSLQIIDKLDCPVALKVNVLDILVILSVTEHEWLKNEIRQIIELALEQNPSPALLSRSKKLLKNLAKSQTN